MSSAEGCFGHAHARSQHRNGFIGPYECRRRFLQEYRLSAYAPLAPPEGSKLRQVLVIVALGAMSHGKWACAESCLRASGEQLLLMLLHALQHNRQALQKAVAASRSATATHTLSMLLLAADARIGLRQTLQKDWHIARCAPSAGAPLPLTTKRCDQKQCFKHGTVGP